MLLSSNPTRRCLSLVSLAFSASLFLSHVLHSSQIVSSCIHRWRFLQRWKSFWYLKGKDQNNKILISMLLFCFLFSLFLGLPIWKCRYMNSLFHWFSCGYCVWVGWGGILNLLHTVCVVLLYFLCISFTPVLSPYVCVVSVCGFNFNEFFGCYPGFLWLWILEGFSVGIWVSDFFDEPWLFNGSFCFLWISGFSLGLGFFYWSLLFYRLSMLLWTKYFCLYLPMEQLQVAEKFCLLCYLLDQQPMCVCVS